MDQNRAKWFKVYQNVPSVFVFVLSFFNILALDLILKVEISHLNCLTNNAE